MDCRSHPNDSHPNDERIFEYYVASRMGETPDLRTVEHLAECGDCSARYRELTAFMNDVRTEADAEVDDVFSAERLQEQRTQIIERLSHVHRTARVIAFPAAAPAGSAPASTRIPSRWLAGAAAAGLFIGVALGGFMGTGSGRRGVVPAQQTLSAPTTSAVPTFTASADMPDDDAFLMALETALENPSPQLSELRSFDALTPHVREITARVR